MTIILFLIDTSASMSQEAFVNGVHKTYLDIAKGAVETFLKYRQRSQDCMGDRYMLLTFEEPPSNIKAGWKENHATFMNELKNLQSSGLTSVGEALKSAFDLLNLNRMQSGIDTYGQGRCPFYLEPAIIILITDGGKYSSRNGIETTLSLPLHIMIPGSKLTKEPFRWDQRLFSLILRMPGHRGDERSEGKVPHDDSPLEKMCEVTGGRSYRIKSQHVLNQCIESLVQKAQPGVVVNFDPVFKEQKDLKDGEMQELIFQNMKKMIYVHKVPGLKQFPMGYWPIPESYWPDVKMTSLPPRDAHPRVRISLQPHDEPQFVRNFPIDKYELEPNQLALWILSKKDPNKVYPMVVVNSNGANHDPVYRMSQVTNEMPFGYLKANSTLMVVHYYVLPYNYQYLLALISELVLKLNLNPTSEWINKFSQYVKNIPQYYYPFLRKALTMINIPYQILQYILPESLDNYLSPTVANQLKQMKNMAKQEQENLCLRVFKQLKQPKMLTFHQHETAKLLNGQPLKMNELVKHPMLREAFSKVHSEINLFENFNITVPTIMTSQSTKNFRNPFDIPRRDLIDEILRMRDNFFKLPTCHINLLSKDAGHSLPISEMGNYQDYLKRREAPLKELEPTNVRQHMFGNPYKRDKNMVMIDEADDIAAQDPSSPNNKMMNMNKKDNLRLSRKRKAGPIRKDYIFKRMRNEFGYPVTPGLPSAPSFIDTDVESDGSEMSFSMDTESVGTPSESSEISKDDDLKLNGIVTIVEAPITDELNKPAGRQGPQLSRMNLLLHDQQHPPSSNYPQQPNSSLHLYLNSNATTATLENSTNINNNHQQQQQTPIVTPPLVSTTPVVTSIPSPTTPTAPTVAVVTTPTIITNRAHHNDMNDASNISKILQSSISNGSGSNSSISTNNNLVTSSSSSTSSSSDKRSHDSIKYYQREDSMKATSESKTQIGRSKKKEPKTPTKVTTTATAEKSVNVNNQHKHVNGSSDAKLTNNSNHHQNGDDEIYSEEDIKEWENANQKTRKLVFCEIRKFGRDYGGLFRELEKVKGNYEIQNSFIQTCINECLRFKRRAMATSIEDWWEKRHDTNCSRNNGQATGKLKI